MKKQKLQPTGHYPGHARARLFEFFNELKTIEDESDKINFMRSFANSSQSMKEAVHIVTYLLTDPVVMFDLPFGSPDYNKNGNLPENAQTLHTIIKKVGYFLTGNDKKIQNPVKREQVFQRWLETVHGGDAEVLVAVKDRDFKKLGVDYALLRKAYPIWTPEVYTDRNVAKEKNIVKNDIEMIKKQQEELFKRLQRETLDELNNSGTEVGIPEPTDLEAPPIVEVTKAKPGRKKKGNPDSLPNV